MIDYVIREDVLQILSRKSAPCDSARLVKDLPAAYEDAEEQGRLVVLPCKVGTEVWFISYCSAINKWFIATKLFGYEDYASFGKTVFLTREEAEKALEGMG